MPTDPIYVPDGEYQLPLGGYFLKVENGKAFLVPSHEVPHLGSLLPVIPAPPPKPSLFERVKAFLSPARLKKALGAAVAASVIAASACFVATHPISCVYVPHPAPEPAPGPKPIPRPPWIPPVPPAPPTPTPDPMGASNFKASRSQGDSSVTAEKLPDPPAPAASAAVVPPRPAAAPLSLDEQLRRKAVELHLSGNAQGVDERVYRALEEWLKSPDAAEWLQSHGQPGHQSSAAPTQAPAQPQAYYYYYPQQQYAYAAQPSYCPTGGCR